MSKPKKCHARVGLGVATLGNDCLYPEGHEGPYSYAKAPGCERLAWICNEHQERCPAYEGSELCSACGGRDPGCQNVCKYGRELKRKNK